MVILIPLSLIGIAFLVYAVFAGATLALPLGLAAAAGLGASALGGSVTASLACGIATFMVVIALGRFAALTLRGPLTRMVLIAAFAAPAALAGFSAARAVGSLFGLASLAASLAVAAVIAAAAAHRLSRPTG